MDISAFRGKRVLILGDLILDRYLHVKTTRNSAEAPIPVYEVKKSVFSLGGAGNVAANISSLGAVPFLICTGHDAVFIENAKALLDKLKNAQYHFLNMGKNGCLKTRLIEDGKQVVCFEEQDMDIKDEGTIEEFMDKVPQIIREFHPDVLILQDYDRGFFSEENIHLILSLCRDNNLPVAVDPKYDHFHSYQNVTLFKPNLAEFTRGIGIDIKGEFSERTVQLLDDMIGAKNYLITLSEQGMLYSNSAGTGKIPSYVNEMVDVSGAGDTVISAAALGLVCGWPLEKIAHVSNTAAAIVCEKQHVRPVSYEELESRLSTSNG